MADETSSQTPQRNAKGQFVAGHDGGPGRPRAMREAAYLRAARSAVSPQEFGDACRAVWRIAVDPESRPADKVRALEVLARHYMPAPTDRYHLEIGLVDPVEVSEFRIAGAKVSEIDSMVANRLRQLLIEQVSYERALERQGLLRRSKTTSTTTNNGGQQ